MCEECVGVCVKSVCEECVVTSGKLLVDGKLSRDFPDVILSSNRRRLDFVGPPSERASDEEASCWRLRLMQTVEPARRSACAAARIASGESSHNSYCLVQQVHELIVSAVVLLDAEGDESSLTCSSLRSELLST